MELCYRKVTVLMIIACDALQVQAFAVVPVSPTWPRTAAATMTMSRLYGMTPRRSKEGDDENEKNADSDDSSFNVSEARRQLESMISNGEDSKVANMKKPPPEEPWTVASLLAAVSSRSNSDNQDDDDDDDNDRMVVTLPPPPPVLTAADRDRRLTEIQLLQKLDSCNNDDKDKDDNEDDDGDNTDNVAVNLLWDLWYGERGLSAKRRLEESNQMMAQGPRSWKQCEELLHDMIADYGIYYYTEPLNRLATLYFLQGRLEESYKLCRVILQIKPWHFGALSGIVLVLQQLGQRSEAQQWAAQCLPPRVANTSFPPFADKNGPLNPLRQEWVRRAVRAAQQALALAEQRAQESLGAPEEYYKNKNADKSSLENTEESDWQ